MKLGLIDIAFVILKVLIIIMEVKFIYKVYYVLNHKLELLIL